VSYHQSYFVVIINSGTSGNDNRIWRTLFQLQFPALYSKHTGDLRDKRANNRVIMWRTLYMGQYKRLLNTTKLEPSVEAFLFSLLHTGIWTPQDNERLCELLTKTEPHARFTYDKYLAYAAFSLKVMIAKSNKRKSSLLHVILHTASDEQTLLELFGYDVFQRHFEAYVSPLSPYLLAFPTPSLHLMYKIIIIIVWPI
jgi:hypothetical protein